MSRRTYILCVSPAEAQRIATARGLSMATNDNLDGVHYAWSRGNFSGSAHPLVLRTPCWTKRRKPDVVDELIAELGYRSAEIVDIPCDRIGCVDRGTSVSGGHPVDHSRSVDPERCEHDFDPLTGYCRNEGCAAVCQSMPPCRTHAGGSCS